MKTLRRSLLFTCLALVSATSLVSASVPIMEVKVVTGTGKLVFNGKTDGAGLFTTKPLGPGDYVVQFNSSSSQGGPFAVVVSAGKKKVVAESVPGSKFTKGGIAMKLKVDKAMSVTGQVAQAGQAASNTDAVVQADGRKVKYINGEKYVWAQSELGSNVGGHWVLADSAAGLNVNNVSTKSIGDLQQSRSKTPTGN
ncbi:MAG: hypothetical protein H0X40_08355 [Chthoniobacterales bacterium]|nr:hypothetical protein [Chthoniobacterales bacterium]